MNAWTTAGPPTASAGVEKPLQSANILGWTDGAVPRTGCPGTSSGVLDRRFPQAESDSQRQWLKERRVEGVWLVSKSPSDTESFG
jgi:hypothetical protein